MLKLPINPLERLRSRCVGDCKRNFDSHRFRRRIVISIKALNHIHVICVLEAEKYSVIAHYIQEQQKAKGYGEYFPHELC